MQKFFMWVLPLLPVPVFLFLWYAPTVIMGNQALDASIKLSWLGVFLSYYGLLFSLYAAFEVSRLTKKHFFKQRSQDIYENVMEISKQVSGFSGSPGEELKSQTFLFNIPGIVRAAKRLDNRDINKISEELLALLNKINESSNNPSVSYLKAGDYPEYFKFLGKITELADEINIQIKDSRAIQ